MKPIYFAVFLALLGLPVCGQESMSCSDYGAALYCSNGLSAIRSGNMMYFSDGTTAMLSGTCVYIKENTQASQDYRASYAAGAALGNLVGGVVSDVRQRRKFERVCEYDPYAQGWIVGRPAFCSEAAIRDACPQVTDFSGFKYAGDTPNHLTWTQGGSLSYLPHWPHGFDGEVACVPDHPVHAIHEAVTWLANFREAQTFLPDKSGDEVAQVVAWLCTHPGEYERNHKAAMYKKLFNKMSGSR